ncbi:MAG: PKD domain-containing protein [Candidatus Schekmanbacteria bacterium]|nr:PKD domain-containing protein [Candidatus Schekmanbacteria bacterium]
MIASASSTSAARSRGARLAAVFMALSVLALGVLLLFLGRRPPQVPALEVRVDAERDRIAVGQGAIELRALVRRLQLTEEELLMGILFEWSATQGHLLSDGNIARWFPGPEPGDAEITVIASLPGYQNGQASVTLRATPASGDPEKRVSRFKRAPALAGPPPSPPIIDEVILEKEEVCEDEENLVTIKAHTEGNADDTYLRYQLIGPKKGAGNKIPTMNEPGADGLNRYAAKAAVWGRGGTRTVLEVPRYKVKKCGPKERRHAWVKHEAVPNTEAGFAFFAYLVADKEFVPVAYEWDFGDGTKLRSDVPRVTHSYEDAIAEAKNLYSSFLVKVTITGNNGDQVTGRAGVEISSRFQENFLFKGVVTLLVEKIPRYAVRQGDVSRQTIRLKNVYDHAIYPEALAREVHVKDEKLEDNVTTERVEWRQVLQADVIGPLEKIDVEMEITDPDVLMIAYALVGFTDDDYRVEARWEIMAPTADPLGPEGEPVRDPRKEWMIRKSMEVLGKSQVSQEEMRQLLYEGRLGPTPTLAPGQTPFPTPRRYW